MQNVVVSPVEMEMTLLKLARTGEVDLVGLGIENLKDYLEKQETLAKKLALEYPYYFNLDMEKKVENPFQFSVDWVHMLNAYQYEVSDFYNFFSQIKKQSFIAREWDYKSYDTFYFETDNFQALRLASKMEDVFIEFYLPNCTRMGRFEFKYSSICNIF